MLIVQIVQVRCPKIELTEGLKANPPVSSIKRKLNDEVDFQCTNGNSLIGSPSVKCLPNEIWDNPIPACQNIVCPKNLTFLATSLRPHLRVQVHSYGSGGNAFFSCQKGYTLNGIGKAKCMKNGEWSVALLDVNPEKEELPRCAPILCET